MEPTHIGNEAQWPIGTLDGVKAIRLQHAWKGHGRLRIPIDPIIVTPEMLRSMADAIEQMDRNIAVAEAEAEYRSALDRYRESRRPRNRIKAWWKQRTQASAPTTTHTD